MKNKSVIALMLAFTMSFTSVCPALAVENTAVESEEVTEKEPEEVSEEDAVPAEETAPEEQNISGADEAVTDASSGNQTEPVETTEVTEDTEEITDETADVTEETENVTDEAADAAEESKDGTDETTDIAVVDGTTEEYSKKAGETAAEPEFTGTITITVEGQTAVPDNSGDESPKDLFEQYMSVEFGLSGRSSMRKAQKATGTRLEGNDLAVYQAVAQELPAIAAGERASTEIELTPEVFGYDKLEWTAEELGVDAIIENGAFSPAALEAAQKKVYFDLDKVDNALLADFPYELYWFDKTKGVETSDIHYSGNSNTISITGNIVVKYSVAGEFAAGEYTVNTDIGQSVQAAVDNANSIIEQYSGASDEDKLQGYKDAICARVSYNDDAAGGGVAYGNPWQLLWVFDNDDETKVVCEGYSKAFKYLCDNASFDDDITCILVTGEMAGGTGAGPHMWNIVKKGDGKNCLVDVTNCDGNSVGAPNQLFMTREADLIINDGIETGYTFHLDSGDITYTYDEDTLNYYEQNEISLGELQHEHTLVETPAKVATCTEEGNIQYWTCSECGKIFSDEAGETEINLEATVVPVKAHTLIHVDANASTCTDTGNKEHWKCSVCGALFSDAEGTTPTTAEAVEIAAIGHTLTHVEAKAATCTEAGNIEYWSCSKCKKLYKDSEGTQEVSEADTVVAAKGHEWNMTYTTDKKPTALSEGSKSIHCSVCGSIKPGSVQVIPKLTPAWKKDSTGWRYDYGDGTYPVNKFENIGGKTYYFNEVGYRITGWKKIGNYWYYFNNDGTMHIGWRLVGSTWYYFNGEGHLLTGLQKVNGYWYYFNGNGARQTGWQHLGNYWYYFDSDGKMHVGWRLVGSTWYYFNGDGHLLTGWQKINGYWYYFNGNGARQTGWRHSGNYWYYFNSDGKLHVGWRLINGTWYYFNGNGAMVTGWQKINGYWYYFNGNGARQTGWQHLGGNWYYFDSDGKLHFGWKQIGSTWYYMDGNGVMVTGWRQIGDAQYYFDGNGAMAVSTWIGSKYVGADGKWIPGYGTGSSSSSSSSSASSNTVYWVAGGSVYHSTDKCPALSRSTNIQHGTIEESGKSRPCKDCY